MVPARYTEVMGEVPGWAGKDKFWWRQKMVKSEGSRDMHKRRVYRRHPGSLGLPARESGYGFAKHLRMDQEIDDIVTLRRELRGFWIVLGHPIIYPIRLPRS